MSKIDFEVIRSKKRPELTPRGPPSLSVKSFSFWTLPFNNHILGLNINESEGCGWEFLKIEFELYHE